MHALAARGLYYGGARLPAAAWRPGDCRWLSVVRVLTDGSVSVDNNGDDDSKSSPEPGHVHVKLRAAPCTPADLRVLTNTQASHHKSSQVASHPLGVLSVGGSEGLWEVTKVGDGVSSLQPGDFAIPSFSSPGRIASGSSVGAIPQNCPQTAPRDSGDGMDRSNATWRSAAYLSEESLVRVQQNKGKGAEGIAPEVLAHVSASVATAIRILTDFAPSLEGALEKGDRVVFTGASSAVAQMLLQLAAARGLESVCLVSSEEERALAEKLGAWKATDLKEFKAMRMNNAFLVADGEGGVLGFTAARALRLRGYYVSYADTSGDGVSLPVAGQIFSDTRCRGFSLSRWSARRSAEEIRSLVSQALKEATDGGFRLEGAREFPLTEAVEAIEATGAPGGPVLLRA